MTIDTSAEALEDLFDRLTAAAMVLPEENMPRISKAVSDGAATLRALAAERDAAVDAAAVLAPGAEAMRAAFAEAMGMHSDATELLAKAIAERDRYKRLAYNAQDVRDRATSERSAAEAERDAALAREARLREALAEMMRWFGKYPEFIPNPEHDERVEQAIIAARAALSGEPPA